ncbi:MAG: SMI1/KNR4 family protein [Myxococcales bacterium]|nr:SMI1/KNR4 family protein [Myxococcales bacterium]
MLEEDLSRILSALHSSFAWAPVCSQSELTEFEARHGIELPHDYRRFMLEVGNGGKAELRDTVFALGRTTYPTDGPLEDVGQLSVECPLVISPDHWNLEGGAGDAVGGEDDGEDEDHDEDDEVFEALQEKWEDELWPVDGIFPFSYQGCTVPSHQRH